MQERSADPGALKSALQHCCHLTETFAAGLFHCYDMGGLPRSNHELELCFGVARVHERRATGRRGAISAVVVRGSVRMMTIMMVKQRLFQAEDLQPRDDQRWRELPAQLHEREETRRRQLHFCNDPTAYLARSSGSSTTHVKFAVQRCFTSVPMSICLRCLLSHD